MGRAEDHAEMDDSGVQLAVERGDVGTEVEDRVASNVLEGVAVSVALGVVLAVTLPEGVTLMDSVAVAVCEEDAPHESVLEPVAVPLDVKLGVRVLLMVREVEQVAVGVAVPVEAAVGVTVDVAVVVGVADELLVWLGVPGIVREAAIDGVMLAEAPMVRLKVTLEERVADTLVEPEKDAAAVELAVVLVAALGDTVALGDTMMLGSMLAEGATLMLAVGEGTTAEELRLGLAGTSEAVAELVLVGLLLALLPREIVEEREAEIVEEREAVIEVKEGAALSVATVAPVVLLMMLAMRGHNVSPSIKDVLALPPLPSPFTASTAHHRLRPKERSTMG